jgi:hypothetical protein
LGNLKGRDHLEGQDINRRIILKMDLKKIGWKDVDWIHLVQDRNWCWDLVNMVLNLWFP